MLQTLREYHIPKGMTGVDYPVLFFVYFFIYGTIINSIVGKLL